MCIPLIKQSFNYVVITVHIKKYIIFVGRQKRIASDQRLAELQTYIALSKLGGKMVTYPVGHGKINPNEM